MLINAGVWRTSTLTVTLPLTSSVLRCTSSTWPRWDSRSQLSFPRDLCPPQCAEEFEGPASRSLQRYLRVICALSLTAFIWSDFTAFPSNLSLVSHCLYWPYYTAFSSNLRLVSLCCYLADLTLIPCNLRLVSHCCYLADLTMSLSKLAM